MDSFSPLHTFSQPAAARPADTIKRQWSNKAPEKKQIMVHAEHEDVNLWWLAAFAHNNMWRASVRELIKSSQFKWIHVNALGNTWPLCISCFMRWFYAMWLRLPSSGRYLVYQMSVQMYHRFCWQWLFIDLHTRKWFRHQRNRFYWRSSRSHLH